MLILTTRFTKKKAALGMILLGVMIAVVVILISRVTSGNKDSLPRLTDNSQRVEYLQSLEWEVIPEPLETLQFLLPATLEEPYLSYNTLQLSQGFDLSTCCGKQISRYTYTVTNYPGFSEGVQANLYICEEFPVAGDICYAGENGFQVALIKPEQKE